MNKKSIRCTKGTFPQWPYYLFSLCVWRILGKSGYYHRPIGKFFLHDGKQVSKFITRVCSDVWTWVPYLHALRHKDGYLWQGQLSFTYKKNKKQSSSCYVRRHSLISYCPNTYGHISSSLQATCFNTSICIRTRGL